MADDQGYEFAETEAGSELARNRLLESSFDPVTIRCMERIGVAEGWRCVDVGAGGGSIARWLTERVGPTGSVVAADIDPRFLNDLPENVSVRILDIRQDDLEEASYDLVHCRFLLQHLADPLKALTRMAAALRAGGVLLAEDGDVGMLRYLGHPDADRINSSSAKVVRALRDAKIADGYIGRRLPGLCH